MDHLLLLPTAVARFAPLLLLGLLHGHLWRDALFLGLRLRLHTTSFASSFAVSAVAAGLPPCLVAVHGRAPLCAPAQTRTN